MASISNIEILGRFQSKALRTIVDTPWLCAKYGYLKGFPNTTTYRKKSTATALNTVLTSAHIQMT
jgi:hypothetical protein